VGKVENVVRWTIELVMRDLKPKSYVPVPISLDMTKKSKPSCIHPARESEGLLGG
jgi:hypothetical protein